MELEPNPHVVATGLPGRPLDTKVVTFDSGNKCEITPWIKDGEGFSSSQWAIAWKHPALKKDQEATEWLIEFTCVTHALFTTKSPAAMSEYWRLVLVGQVHYPKVREQAGNILMEGFPPDLTSKPS
jgi:hypothetical protein